MKNTCYKCEKPLQNDEISIYRRLVDRGAAEYLCMDCLAGHFKCSKVLIAERIKYYKEQGCTLFCKGPD